MIYDEHFCPSWNSLLNVIFNGCMLFRCNFADLPNTRMVRHVISWMSRTENNYPRTGRCQIFYSEEVMDPEFHGRTSGHVPPDGICGERDWMLRGFYNQTCSLGSLGVSVLSVSMAFSSLEHVCWSVTYKRKVLIHVPPFPNSDEYLLWNF